METKLLKLDAQGYPEILVGADKGRYGVGRGHFVLIRKDNEIRFNYILGVGRTNDVWKSITMLWVQGIIVAKAGAIELKPLPEYFDAAGVILPEYVEKVSNAQKESTSDGMLPNGVYAYDYFYDLPGTDRSGVVLYGIAVDRFFAEQFRDLHILKVTAQGFEFIQPVTADKYYELLEEAPFKYQVTINPVDGVEPFEFSSDNETYSAMNVFAFEEPIDAVVYVRDNAGTVAQLDIKSTDWNNDILPQPPTP